MWNSFLHPLRLYLLNSLISVVQCHSPNSSDGHRVKLIHFSFKGFLTAIWTAMQPKSPTPQPASGHTNLDKSPLNLQLIRSNAVKELIKLLSKVPHKDPPLTFIGRVRWKPKSYDYWPNFDWTVRSAHRSPSVEGTNTVFAINYKDLGIDTLFHLDNKGIGHAAQNFIYLIRPEYVLLKFLPPTAECWFYLA